MYEKTLKSIKKLILKLLFKESIWDLQIKQWFDFSDFIQT